MNPMKSLKDVLRVYIQTQLPEITQEMSNAMVAKEKRHAQADKLALKKLKEQRDWKRWRRKRKRIRGKGSCSSRASFLPWFPSLPKPPSLPWLLNRPWLLNLPMRLLRHQPSNRKRLRLRPWNPRAKAGGTVNVKSLAPAPHKLKPVVLPADQGDMTQAPAGAPPAMTSAPAPEAGNLPAAPASEAPPALSNTAAPSAYGTAPPPISGFRVARHPG